jgi:hypothetical protein
MNRVDRGTKLTNRRELTEHMTEEAARVFDEAAASDRSAEKAFSDAQRLNRQVDWNLQAMLDRGDDTELTPAVRRIE